MVGAVHHHHQHHHLNTWNLHNHQHLFQAAMISNRHSAWKPLPLGCLVYNPVITKPERPTLSFTIVIYILDYLEYQLVYLRSPTGVLGHLKLTSNIHFQLFKEPFHSYWRYTLSVGTETGSNFTRSSTMYTKFFPLI